MCRSRVVDTPVAKNRSHRGPNLEFDAFGGLGACQRFEGIAC